MPQAMRLCPGSFSRNCRTVHNLTSFTRQIADADVPSVSRWQELKQYTEIILKGTAVFGKTVDVHYLNRGSFYGISRFDQLATAFFQPPRGGTNLVATLNKIWNERVRPDMPRPLIVHVFTDGTTGRLQRDEGRVRSLIEFASAPISRGCPCNII
jgi:hypothetical protein